VFLLFVLAGGGLSARRTDADKFDMITGNRIPLIRRNGCMINQVPIKIDIVDSVTVHTVYVIVWRCLKVKALLATADFQFPDDACFRKGFKVAVNRRKADARHTLLDPFVQFVRSQVLAAVLKLFENDFTLIRHSHMCSAHINNNYQL